MTAPELPPRDAHLRQALRHAPDAQLEPPAALSARILRDARRAVAPPPWHRRMWRSVHGVLGRPAGAAAFASVLLAGVIATLWRDGPPPERLAEDTVVSRSAPAPAPAPPPPAAPRAAESPAAEAEPAALARAQRERQAGAAQDAKRRTADEAREAPAAAPPAPDPLAGALDALRAEGAGDDGLAPWLQWQAQARGRWQQAPAFDSMRDGAGTPLLSPRGRVLGRLWIAADGVIWQPEGDAARWHVTLAPAALAALRSRFLR